MIKINDLMTKLPVVSCEAFTTLQYGITFSIVAICLYSARGRGERERQRERVLSYLVYLRLHFGFDNNCSRVEHVIWARCLR